MHHNLIGHRGSIESAAFYVPEKKVYITGTDTTTCNPYFREIISSVNPDIIAVQEMTFQAGVDGYRYHYTEITKKLMQLVSQLEFIPAN
jgi:endonuclease/exonuclease/phosphatase family metal-dependent hydrolase